MKTWRSCRRFTLFNLKSSDIISWPLSSGEGRVEFSEHCGGDVGAGICRDEDPIGVIHGVCYHQIRDISRLETKRDCISKKTITEFLERLALYEKWVLKSLLGDNQTVKVAAVNVKVIVRKNNVKPETHFGDLYVVQNVKNGTVSFKLYSPKDNKFIWTIDTVPNLDGYVDLKCNTHILHMGDSVYTFKFPDKKERTLFRDNLNKFLFFEKSKR